MFSEKTVQTLRFTLKTSLIFLTWVPVIYTFNEHVCYISKVEGSSMKPTFNPSSTKSDFVLLWKWNLKPNLNINDVILLRSPINPEKIYAKRIKGLQGDKIQTRYPYPKQSVLIPRNHLWVEGDNIHSIDSNNFGPVSNGLVIGKACYIIFPFSRFGPIPDGGRECRESKLRNFNQDKESQVV
ncbi:hypothetical protein PACTADRAFT_45887 [Pachysolen tannophilus NRRL Y-2460]|uniref:Mitochondrial inner membrane protease subunit 2 n=1 Tax=Pachysolen tannophilus NRRL Y-2460 TaxID=669874 RepID=A0A1E4TPJ1_PACTA|nr:hypothetical protein PACTADRAFT_45887 [Pachysolen tannophilus NRRL Y-2460]